MENHRLHNFKCRIFQKYRPGDNFGRLHSTFDFKPRFTSLRSVSLGLKSNLRSHFGAGAEFYTSKNSSNTYLRTRFRKIILDENLENLHQCALLCVDVYFYLSFDVFSVIVAIAFLKDEDSGPVHILLYRGSYGSTDCDALCQVPKPHLRN